MPNIKINVKFLYSGDEILVYKLEFDLIDFLYDLSFEQRDNGLLVYFECLYLHLCEILTLERFSVGECMFKLGVVFLC